jgi:hypothetical protein
VGAGRHRRLGEEHHTERAVVVMLGQSFAVVEGEDLDIGRMAVEEDILGEGVVGRMVE